MHTKLTLRIKGPLIKAAKKFSKTHGKSLSQLVADYLYLITEEASSPSLMQPLPLTQSLKGILRGKKVSESDYKKHLEDKYR